MNFDVLVDLQGKELSVCVLLAEAEEYNAEFAYYLYDAKNNIIEKQMYTKEASFVFWLKESGSYYVKAFVRSKKVADAEYWKKSKTSKIIEFQDIDFEQEYKIFLETCRSLPRYQLSFCKSEKPRQDILLAKIPEIVRLKIKTLSNSLELKYHELTSVGKNCVAIISGEEVYKSGNCEVLFSGVGKMEDKLICGMQDLHDIETVDALSEQIGSFWMLRKKDDTVILETDYFGVEKIYYYSAQEIFLASNRVHLLLLAMKEVGLERIPNYEKIYAYLPLNNQLFMQNFSRELNIKDVLTLPVDSRICMDLKRDRILIEKTELYYTLSAPVSYDEDTYQELLHKAADEIVSNAKAALEYSAFDKYVVHVTGGLDSRLVYCALTRLPEYRDRIIASTSGAKKSQRDAEIGLKVVSKWPVSMGPIPLSEPVPDKEDQTLKSLSFILGTTSEVVKAGKRLPYKNTCILNGFFGEIVARSYYARGKYNSILGDSTITEKRCFSHLFEDSISYKVFNRFLGNVINYSVCNRFLNDAISHKGLNRFLLNVIEHNRNLENRVSHKVFNIDDCIERNFIKEVVTLPGRTNLEKYENHYLYYRNGLHFNVCHTENIAPEWGILQSKSMFKLKYMVFPLDYGIRLQLDLMYLLNPEIASLEYEAKNNESERKKLHKLYGKYPKNTKYDAEQFDKLKQEWRRNLQYLDEHQNQDIKAGNVLNQTEALNALHYLYKNLNLHPDAVREMYHYICYEKDSNEKRRFLVKLYSLYFEFAI